MMYENNKKSKNQKKKKKKEEPKRELTSNDLDRRADLTFFLFFPSGLIAFQLFKIFMLLNNLYLLDKTFYSVVMEIYKYI